MHLIGETIILINIKLTENNNGIFINLTNLSDENKILLVDYIKHIKNQNELNDVCMEAVELHYQINHIH